MELSLQILDKARQALEQATTFDDTKLIRDKAEAMHMFAKRQRYSVECVNHCVEIKIRAERKLGQMLQQTSETSEEWTKSKPHRKGLPTLEELGVDIGQSRDWQRLATLDDKDFEPWLEKARVSGKRINVAFLLDMANEKLTKGKYRGQSTKKFLLHLISRVKKLQTALTRISKEKTALENEQPKEMKMLCEAVDALKL